MIKFFRHIRKTLLEQNKMGKYFKYAIGEIVLVVIGILIALQINTTYQNHSNKNKLNKYLTLLIEDLNNDKARFVFCKNADSLRAENLNQYIYSGKKILNNQIFKSAFATQTSIIHNGTYNSIKANNILELIDDIKVQKAISEYYSAADKIQRFEYAFINNQFGNFIDVVLKRKYLTQFFHQMEPYSENITLSDEDDAALYGYFINLRDNAKDECEDYEELLREIDLLSDLLTRQIK